MVKRSYCTAGKKQRGNRKKTERRHPVTVWTRTDMRQKLKLKPRVKSSSTGLYWLINIQLTDRVSAGTPGRTHRQANVSRIISRVLTSPLLRFLFHIWKCGNRSSSAYLLSPHFLITNWILFVKNKKYIFLKKLKNNENKSVSRKWTTSFDLRCDLKSVWPCKKVARGSGSLYLISSVILNRCDLAKRKRCP